MAFIFIGLLVMLGLGLDVGLIYIERSKLSRAIDAAAMAGVSELPDEERALKRAQIYLFQNGYDGNDIEWLFRGCQTKDEAGNVGEAGFTVPYTFTKVLTGSVYALPDTYPDWLNSVMDLRWAPGIVMDSQAPPVSDQTARVTFLVDTGPFQTEGNACNPDPDDTNPIYGTANKVRLAGRVYIQTYFMRFVGWPYVMIEGEATAEKITDFDFVFALDVSAMSEAQTACYDCWLKDEPTGYGTVDDSTGAVNIPVYPDDGLFNPLPTVPKSSLCTAAPAPLSDSGYDYLIHEAELYSTVSPMGGWDFDRRVPGQGFWAVQRSSRNITSHTFEVSTAVILDEGEYYQGNQAGQEDNQSSNPCDITTITWGGSPATGVVPLCDTDYDQSAYLMARPSTTYVMQVDANGNGELDTGDKGAILGGAYNLQCFQSGGPCWGNSEAGYSNQVPYVEYDFTADWSGSVYIWARVQAGGTRADEWTGRTTATFDDWGQTIYWSLNGGSVYENTAVPALSSLVTGANTQLWRDNRATSTAWRWIRLTDSGIPGAGSTAQQTLRIYMGGGGYKIDKLVFTNDPETNPLDINALTQGSGDLYDKGKPATNGSATREACNFANPLYGLTVDRIEAGCPLNSTEMASYAPGGLPDNDPRVTTGEGCSTVPFDDYNALEDDLYNDVQPLRRAKESIKTFITKKDDNGDDLFKPRENQAGFVAFAEDVIDGDLTGEYDISRSKLRCKKWATVPGDPTSVEEHCTIFPPILAYDDVLLAIEAQWPRGPESNMAAGLRESLEELGIAPSDALSLTVTHNCGNTIDDGNACDRRSTVRRVIVLMVASSPTTVSGDDPCMTDLTAAERDGMWEGAIGTDDPAYECAMYYARRAALEDIVVHTIALGPGVDTNFLTALATGVDPGIPQTYFTGRGGMYQDGSTSNNLDYALRQILGNLYVRLVG
jgi:hypothetical protein